MIGHAAPFGTVRYLWYTDLRQNDEHPAVRLYRRAADPLILIDHTQITLICRMDT